MVDLSHPRLATRNDRGQGKCILVEHKATQGSPTKSCGDRLQPMVLLIANLLKGKETGRTNHSHVSDRSL